MTDIVNGKFVNVETAGGVGAKKQFFVGAKDDDDDNLSTVFCICC